MSTIHEVFRYAKAHRTRSYGLRHVGEDSAELWVTAAEPGRPARSRKLVTLADGDETRLFLDGVKQELRLGGWSPVSTG
jgi:hypothetical protein